MDITSTTYVPQQKRSFVFKGGKAGRNRVREATDRSNAEKRERERERGWRHESVERGELNGAETNLKTSAARRERRKGAWVALRSAYGIGETAHVYFLNLDMPIIPSRAWLHGIFIIFLNVHWIKDDHFFFLFFFFLTKDKIFNGQRKTFFGLFFNKIHIEED